MFVCILAFAFQVGVVEQEPVLFGGTVADNIRYGRPEASQREVENAAAVANASAFIEARLAIDLSQGVRRRLVGTDSIDSSVVGGRENEKESLL